VGGRENKGKIEGIERIDVPVSIKMPLQGPDAECCLILLNRVEGGSRYAGRMP
jgi:hypothetical protein